MDFKTYTKRDEDGIAYIDRWYGQTHGFEFAEKLALLEEAEKEGYIARCKKCKSYKISIDKGTFTTWGDKEESYTNYNCDDCGNSW